MCNILITYVFKYKNILKFNLQQRMYCYESLQISAWAWHLSPTADTAQDRSEELMMLATHVISSAKLQFDFSLIIIRKHYLDSLNTLFRIKIEKIGGKISITCKARLRKDIQRCHIERYLFHCSLAISHVPIWVWGMFPFSSLIPSHAIFTLDAMILPKNSPPTFLYFLSHRF